MCSKNELSDLLKNKEVRKVSKTQVSNGKGKGFSTKVTFFFEEGDPYQILIKHTKKEDLRCEGIASELKGFISFEEKRNGDQTRLCFVSEAGDPYLEIFWVKMVHVAYLRVLNPKEASPVSGVVKFLGKPRFTADRAPVKSSAVKKKCKAILVKVTDTRVASKSKKTTNNVVNIK